MTSQIPSIILSHFMVTLSALSTGKARPKHDRQQSCLCGSNLFLAQQPEWDLKTFITLSRLIFYICTYTM